MKTISNAFMAVVLMVFLISSAVVVTLAFRPLYYGDIQRLNIVEESGYSEEEIRTNYDVLIDYNLSPFKKELEFPTLPMSEEGKIHFEEVKAIFQGFLKGMILSGLIGIAGIVIKRRKQDYLYLKWASIISITIPAVIGVVTAVYWEKVFVLFHELMFDNDYWLFDPVTDPVITILPDAFFLHCALMIVGIVVLGAIGCYGLWRYTENKS